MTEEYFSGYCFSCECQRKLARPKTNHILHLLLSVVTAGLWLVVWLAMFFRFGGWYCDQCGSADVDID